MLRMLAVSLIWVLLILGFLGNDFADPCVLRPIVRCLANDAHDDCRFFRFSAAGCASSSDGWPMMLRMLSRSVVWVLQGAPHREMAGP